MTFDRETVDFFPNDTLSMIAGLKRLSRCSPVRFEHVFVSRLYSSSRFSQLVIRHLDSAALELGDGLGSVTLTHSVPILRRRGFEIYSQCN